MDNEEMLKEFFKEMMQLPEEKYITYKERVLKGVKAETRIILEKIFEILEREES